MYHDEKTPQKLTPPNTVPRPAGRCIKVARVTGNSGFINMMATTEVATTLVGPTAARKATLTTRHGVHQLCPLDKPSCATRHQCHSTLHPSQHYLPAWLCRSCHMRRSCLKNYRDTPCLVGQQKQRPLPGRLLKATRQFVNQSLQ